MRTIYIKYNPYKVETEIKIDGKDVKKNSALNVGDKRLQEWIEDLPQVLVNECNTKDFRITFHGTTLDYEDLLSVAGEARNKGCNIECEHVPAKEVKDKEGAIEEIFKDIQNGPFDELRQTDVIKAFETATSSDFPVNVIATMSAGKSTLINALLRKKLMPAKQEACTATITEIKDNDSEFYRATVYDKNYELLEVQPELTLAIMQTLNSNPEVSLIRAEGDIPFVSAGEVSLVFVDTPGPNNSRSDEHRKATFRALSESSKTLVLYVLNATQLAVNDDNNLLNNVAESMKVGGKQSKDRFIFVVNKLDEFQPGEDSVGESIEKVKNYLEDKGIKNPNIFPATALTALNIRTMLNDFDMQTSLGDVDDPDILGILIKVKKINASQELHLEDHAPMTPSIRGEINGMLANAKEAKDSRQEALVHSGIIPIEAAIRMYVEKYAKTAKIKNIVDTFDKKLESAKSFENIKQEIAANQDKQKEILAQIDLIKTKIKSGAEAKKFKDKIKEINYQKEIDEIVNAINTEAQSKVSSHLSNREMRLSKRAAKSFYEENVIFANNLQTELLVKLETVITSFIDKNAQELLQQYKQRLLDLAQDVQVGTINIDPLQLLKGEIGITTNVDSLIAKSLRVETVKVGEKWIENQDKKWYKFWTWFDEAGHYEDIMEDMEYIDVKELGRKFFAPLQKQLMDNGDNAIKYANKQADLIKKEFEEKFDELDNVLNMKLVELEECATDSLNVEKIIKEAQSRLNWLNNIQTRIQMILDI